MSTKQKLITSIKNNVTIVVMIILSLIFVTTLSVFSSDWNLRLSLAFTSIASVSTVATLIIAIKLYDKFGLKNQLVIKQAEKIFELFDILLEQTFVAGSSPKWLIRANLDQLKSLTTIEAYPQDQQKKLLTSVDNYEAFYTRINPIRQSYWLPREIQEALDFFMIGLTTDVEFDSQQHLKMHYSNSVVVTEFELGLPEQTLGSFIENLANLLEHIDKWLKKHSQIEITLVPRY